MRGIAILLVVLYHLDTLVIIPQGWGLVRDAAGAAHIGDGSRVLRFMLLPFHMGRVGVNLFFVISGLCIHMRFARQVAKNPAAPFALKTFFQRRFFRIYPVYWVALALGAFVAPLLYAATYPSNPPVTGFPDAHDLLLHVFMLHTFSKFTSMSIIRVLWSIATEEQFYLLYPLVFVAIGRRVPITRLVPALFVLSMVWRLTFVLANPAPATFFDGPFLVWVFCFSLPRYYEWALGALLAHALARRLTLAELLPFLPSRLTRARPAIVVVFGLGFILIGAASLARVQVKWLIEDPSYSTAWFFVLAATLLPASTPTRTAQAAPWRARADVALAFVAERLRGLGRRSYSVYLLHEIVLMTVAGIMQRFHLPAVTVAAPLACAFTVAVCYPFYRWVEAPFERRSKAVGKLRRA
ncbi:MAG TPA: acyltransferase [Polyangia bacterium]|jgi:peptidoglycan/LPS O-acetylase OafA/YrhL|nr:acyltransferase [Polyangia bacterium]